MISFSFKEKKPHDKYKDKLAYEKSFYAKINMNFHHSHEINTTVLSKRRIGVETADKFNQLFESGLNAPAATRAHDELIDLPAADQVNIADTGQCPTDRQIAYMYEKFRVHLQVSYILLLGSTLKYYFIL